MVSIFKTYKFNAVILNDNDGSFVPGYKILR
jgi:hypothetical protein